MNSDIRINPILEAQLLAEWNQFHGANYRLRSHDLKWNLTQQNLVTYSLTKIGSTPVVLAQATEAGVQVGIPARNIWLSLWGEIRDEESFAVELLKIKERAKKKKIVIGGDEFHLVAGLPMTAAGQKLKAALEAVNFEGGEAVDYVGKIQSEPVTSYIAEAKNIFSERGLSFTEVTTGAEILAAEKFLAKEFPGRWAREFQFWSSREDTQRAYWKLLRAQDGEIIGFARMAVRARVTPLDSGWSPGALKISSADCCLGPIGVATSQRGKGTGKVLLGLVLESLRNSPAEQICIDWTNAFKYYEPLKFEVARRYWTAWRLDPETS